MLTGPHAKQIWHFNMHTCICDAHNMNVNHAYKRKFSSQNTSSAQIAVQHAADMTHLQGSLRLPASQCGFETSRSRRAGCPMLRQASEGRNHDPQLQSRNGLSCRHVARGNQNSVFEHGNRQASAKQKFKQALTQGAVEVLRRLKVVERQPALNKRDRKRPVRGETLVNVMRR